VSGFSRRDYGRGHAYYLDGRKLDGVTTILGKGLPKPALVNWAAKAAAALAVDEWDRLAELPPSERLKLIADAPNAARDKAGIRGTRVHALADRLARGEEVAVPEDLAGHVESCVKFLDDWEPRTILTEAPVYHEKYLYAGTLDLIAEMDGRRWLLDFKTAKGGAYGDTAFQLAAYRYATHYLGYASDRKGTAGVELPMIQVGMCGVIWLRADGYDLYPYHADEGVFRQFLYVQQCARAAEDCRDYRGDALTPPVRSQAS